VTKEVKVIKKKSSKKEYHFDGYYATGKRKDAMARVFISKGSGNITINGKDYKEYLSHRPVLVNKILKPFEVVGLNLEYDIKATAKGGGIVGQAGAVAHGISKALVEINPDWKKTLRLAGFITRDSRVKEAKKYGRKKARKGYQYRKR
jgi:small subunit ribosomal protein S9